MAGEAGELRLRALRPSDSFTSIQTGDARFVPLKVFARKNAHKYEQANLARTYVVHDGANARIAAFVTLVCSEVASKDQLPVGGGVTFPYQHYPAVKIARLLVDSRYRGQDIGRTLVDFALGLARSEICPAVGCRFVVVDSKKESLKFYERCGFTLIDTQTNRALAEPVMFLDLHKAST